MKAFVIDRYGRQSGGRIAEMSEPELGDADVLVQVHAAGVNLLDSKIGHGDFKLILPYRLPLVLGHDVAGVVVRVGARVKQFGAGDEVYSRPADHRIGTFLPSGNRTWRLSPSDSRWKKLLRSRWSA
jgi:NADPH:quinone reductase-like Zn-dependent oxidoreductase